MPKCKKVFFWYVFLLFGGFVCLLAVFSCLCFVKRPQKGYSPAILEVFCLFCSPKRPVFEILLFFLFCFFSGFPFVFPFKNPFFAFYPSNSFLQKALCRVSFSFSFCLPFPFLRFACLFDANFPNIPLVETQFAFVFGCLCFSVVLVCCCCFVFSLCMFQPFCFLLLCWLCFGVIVCVLICVFVSVFFLVLVSGL